MVLSIGITTPFISGTLIVPVSYLISVTSDKPPLFILLNNSMSNVPRNSATGLYKTFLVLPVDVSVALVLALIENFSVLAREIWNNILLKNNSIKFVDIFGARLITAL